MQRLISETSLAESRRRPGRLSAACTAQGRNSKRSYGSFGSFDRVSGSAMPKQEQRLIGIVRIRGFNADADGLVLRRFRGEPLLTHRDHL